ncbi:phosphoribosylglycinamide formyltransferase [Enterococcus sp. AZ072]|uniref:phosphoribosylglycinamide formyltransferase n=1 Tax=unclassified Enterococcus TaxID=2608891 RepID=UPI003D27680A
MRLAVLASGNGSNFEAIIQAVEVGEILAEIVLLFADHHDAYVLKRAKDHNIPYVSFELKEFEDKQTYEAALLELLADHEIELIVLAGYMRIIGKSLLQAYANRIINLHPALLPNFPGLHGIRDAYDAKVSETGVTVHYIDSGVDTGPIIAQEAVKIESSDTLEQLEEKIHQVEHQLYPRVIAEIVKEIQR